MPAIPAALAVAVLLPILPAAAPTMGVAGFYNQPALHGDRLVFVSEGDLWTCRIPADPGQPILAHRLTATPDAESNPIISPDGTRLAFAAQTQGNVDVHVMAIDGGPPSRLTWHEGQDLPVAWSLDGGTILFTSPRRSPMGRPELWRVPAAGGQPASLGFGECSMAAPFASSSGEERLAFTRWSNENWNWRGYRGGTAPDLWRGDLARGTFEPLVTDPANDLFPMPLGGRVYFASDRDGQMNIWSVSESGGDLRQHTRFAAVAGRPTEIAGYDLRWPRADAEPGGTRIAFAQGADLALLDTRDDRVSRLDLRLASDRAGMQPRFVDPMPTLTEFRLTPDASRVLLVSRGELASAPAGDPKAGTSGAASQLTRSAGVREWGVTSWQAPAAKGKGDGGARAADAIDARTTLVFITDEGGEQQIASMPLDGSAPPRRLTSDRNAWLMPPQVSSDGRWIAFADKTQALYLLDATTGERREVDRSAGWEIVDYRFSPDGRYLAYAKPLPTGYRSVLIHDVAAKVNIPVSDAISNDDEPRWDPAGRYLYVLSKRHFDPILSEIDFEHAFTRMTEVHAFPLQASTPPPSRSLAHGTGFELEAWSKGAGGADGKDEEAGKDAKDAGDGKEGAGEAPEHPKPITLDPVRIESEGLGARRFVLPIEPGNYVDLEAIPGGVLFLGRPTTTISEQPWPVPPLGVPDATLFRWQALGGTPQGSAEPLLEEVSSYTVSGDASTLAWIADRSIQVRPVDMAPAGKGGGDDEDGARRSVDAGTLRLHIDPAAEWRQMLAETWRLQRDFYWDPGMRGVDWSAAREKFMALLPRVGTRRELATLQGMMVGELGTSHTYVSPGSTPIPGVDPKPIPVGSLGADVDFDGQVHRIARILPSDPWDRAERSPLAAEWLGVKEGSVLLAIDGRPLSASTNVDELLMDRAGRVVRLEIADDAAGANRRSIEVRALGSDRGLRYSAWVEANRRRVDEVSKGTLGYLHIPDMDSEGLIAFSRLYYAQLDRRGMVVDIRDNGGGYVSQMIVQRLARRVWAFQKPRHGAPEKYPQRTLHGHVVVLIDQHAGSDGDIFPESIRILGIGPLIGMRTWGGVVGIRGDKPSIDAGMTTQPEFAWWEPKRGWSLENSGVAPDIEVEITPADRLAGRDPQLERAIQELESMLGRDPKPLPAPPGGWNPGQPGTQG